MLEARLVRLSESAGASAARNVGFNSTQCDWISFLDSDDRWMSQKPLDLASDARMAAP
jgi:glycosyltransferase involved in cell wall biosynthesis